MLKIAHLTSAHQRYDTRIFLKMCSSLAQHGFDTSLIVADGNGDERKNNVQIYDVGAKGAKRIHRMTVTVRKVYTRAKALDADVYHLHDPELMFVALKLKLSGKRVIFDAHEDLPKQLLGKAYLNAVSRVVLSKVFALTESLLCARLDAVVCATPSIGEKFKKINRQTLVINNYPILDELSTRKPWEQREDAICYVGCMDSYRGAKELVHSIGLTDAKLKFAGVFSDEALKNEVKTYTGWKQVIDYGFIDRKGVAELMSESKAGLVIFHAIPNHIDAQPNKMFEYMSAGLPIIVSNFPLWKQVVEENDCGICVDPLNANEIAQAIRTIIEHPEKSSAMGTNGQEAVVNKYNWGVESKKLTALYEGL
ncbi:MAG: glycosyltransferase [Pseudomonadales bacterium]|nr:glycosyltransferase [Pseudomonadales bacterium]